MHRRTALPPKHVRDGSILAMNERPAFSLRFTNPWAVEQMQRAEEHRERVRTDRKPLLKGQRDKIYRSVRMRNMLKRFVAEDDQLILNPIRRRRIRSCVMSVANQDQARAGPQRVAV